MMPAILGLLLAIVLGSAIGGKVGRICSIQLTGMWPLLGLFVVQSVARGRLVGGSEHSAALWTWIAASIGVLAVLMLNWRLPGVAVAASGIGTNVVVVLANGAMPVGTMGIIDNSAAFEAALERSIMYAAVNPATVLAWLGDVIPVGIGRWTFLLSAGDVALLVGVCTLLTAGMVRSEIHVGASD